SRSDIMRSNAPASSAAKPGIFSSPMSRAAFSTTPATAEPRAAWSAWRAAGPVASARTTPRSFSKRSGETFFAIGGPNRRLLRQRRHQPPDEVRRQRARLSLVEFVHDFVEPLGVREPVALADVFAEHPAQLRSVLLAHLGRLAAGLAQLGEDSALADVQQVSPHFLARRRRRAVVAHVPLVEALQVS